jgi:hypothetical protein
MRQALHALILSSDFHLRRIHRIGLAALLAVCLSGAGVWAQQQEQFGIRVDGQGMRTADVSVPTELVCWVEGYYLNAFLDATTSIYSPTSRHLATHHDPGKWHALYHEGRVSLDEWSRPGEYFCLGRLRAFEYPGGPLIGDSVSERLRINVNNSQCNCIAPTQNRAITRNSTIGFMYLDPNMPGFVWDSMNQGRRYWNEMLEAGASPVRIDEGWGFPVFIEPIAQAGVAARFTNDGGTERIEVDPDYFNWGWDPLVWDHIMTHELGHALGFIHGSCGQTDTVMYSPVNVPAQGQAGNPNDYLGRFSSPPHTDQCYVRSEYRAYQ